MFAELARFKAEQTHINHLLRTTELAYGYVLMQRDVFTRDGPERKARAVIGAIERSQVWFQTKAGEAHFNECSDVFLELVAKSTTELAGCGSVRRRNARVAAQLDGVLN